jgi:hypothetical protein
VFSAAGAYIRGFDHESRLSPWTHPSHQIATGLLDGLPDSLRHHVDEPAFASHDGMPAISVCMWREGDADRWSAGVPADPRLRSADGGAEWLFKDVDGTAQSYLEFARDYYAVEINLADVEHVMAGRPVTADLVRRLNQEADVAAVLAEVAELGYPV